MNVSNQHDELSFLQNQFHEAQNRELFMRFDATSTTSGNDLKQERFTFPNKSLVTNTRVDFKPFLPLKAKIDCIVFRCHEDDLLPSSLAAIRSGIKGGRLETPRDRKRWAARGGPWLAVHDPSLRDLQFLVERFWNSKVVYIEFAVDACLPPGSNDLHLLDILKAQLRHCLFPQRHPRLGGARRKFYHLVQKKYRNDGLGTALPDTQIIWEGPRYDDQLALYVKTLDGNSYVAQPWVRIEARLEGSGPSAAGLDRVGMLPHFAGNLRGYLTPMFWIAAGFKNHDDLAGERGVPNDPWRTWGTQWTSNGKARLEPDSGANAAVGAALNELRRSLMQLKPPSAVAHRYDAWIDETTP